MCGSRGDMLIGIMVVVLESEQERERERRGREEPILASVLELNVAMSTVWRCEGVAEDGIVGVGDGGGETVSSPLTSARS